MNGGGVGGGVDTGGDDGHGGVCGGGAIVVGGGTSTNCLCSRHRGKYFPYLIYLLPNNTKRQAVLSLFYRCRIDLCTMQGHYSAYNTF